jgi:hypothetical protein
VTKTFCDCCGKDINQNNPEFDTILVEIPFTEIDRRVKITKDQPIHGDICVSCVKQKVHAALQKEVDASNTKRQVKITPPPQASTEGIQWAELQRNAAKAVNELADEIWTAESKLTREQFREAILQAIQSGDFMRHVRIHDPVADEKFILTNSQIVTYIPFQRVKALEANIYELKGFLDTAINLLSQVKECTIDRDFRSASIENLCKNIELFKERVDRYEA